MIEMQFPLFIEVGNAKFPWSIRLHPAQRGVSEFGVERSGRCRVDEGLRADVGEGRRRHAATEAM